MKQWKYTFALIPRTSDSPEPYIFLTADSSEEPLRITSDKFVKEVTLFFSPAHLQPLIQSLNLEKSTYRLYDFFRDGLEIALEGNETHQLILVDGPGITNPIYINSTLLFYVYYFEALLQVQTNYQNHYAIEHYRRYDEVCEVVKLITKELKSATKKQRSIAYSCKAMKPILKLQNPNMILPTRASKTLMIITPFQMKC